MTKNELKHRLQGRVDEYNATLAPDVHVSETARAGLNLLREAAGLTLADPDAGAHRSTLAARILAAFDGDAA